MPFSFEEHQRPEQMHQKEGQAAEHFTDPAELLYRRCDKSCIGPASEVLEPAVKEHNLSVLRSRFSAPDHARWDSKVDCRNVRAPLVYPEHFVVEFAVATIPPEKRPEMPAAKTHSFHVIHVPFSDNYAHSEIRIHRDGKWADQERDLSGRESKLAKKLLQAKLAEAARVRLRPFEESGYAAPGEGTRAAAD